MQVRDLGYRAGYLSHLHQLGSPDIADQDHHHYKSFYADRRVHQSTQIINVIIIAAWTLTSWPTNKPRRSLSGITPNQPPASPSRRLPTSSKEPSYADPRTQAMRIACSSWSCPLSRRASQRLRMKTRRRGSHSGIVTCWSFSTGASPAGRTQLDSPCSLIYSVF